MLPTLTSFFREPLGLSGFSKRKLKSEVTKQRELCNFISRPDYRIVKFMKAIFF